MRELLNRDIRHRVKGVPALRRRLLGLRRAVGRYGEHRARTHAELSWAARVADALDAAVTAAWHTNEDEGGTR